MSDSEKRWTKIGVLGTVIGSVIVLLFYLISSTWKLSAAVEARPTRRESIETVQRLAAPKTDTAKIKAHLRSMNARINRIDRKIDKLLDQCK